VSVEFYLFDADYVRRLAEGDPATDAHFGTYFGKFIFLKLRSRRVTPEMIEDVRQETMLRVLKVLRQGAGVTHPERFGSFVNSVSNNVLLEFNHKNSKHPPMDDDTPEPFDNRVDLDASIVTEERKRMVAAVLDELSAKDREILRLVFFEDSDRSVICKRLKVDLDYLRVLLHRAKAKFQTAYVKKHGTSPYAANFFLMSILGNACVLGLTILLRWK
jgi:RNA polymerase sigma-70 factor (ECF subfamily)